MVLTILYVVLFTLSGFYSWPIVNDSETAAATKSEENEILILLEKIQSEQNICYHCINQYSTQNDVNRMIQNQRRFYTREENLKKLRLLFNFISIINTLVIFIIYGGLVVLNILLIFHSVGTFIFIYIDNSYLIIVEYLLILFSLIIFLKTLYILFIDIKENQKEPLKED
jgi:hypothetical protein